MPDTIQFKSFRGWKGFRSFLFFESTDIVKLIVSFDVVEKIPGYEKKFAYYGTRPLCSFHLN